ncbi:hypothetical protein SORBI_3007G084650 [Sorghum bicolor]|uniref:Uncharacterized protein n=1 Tax=Sorghum bicolor TaxID=4558 RepID=A0A1Z5R8Q8_SORBI|nr:hypothetical protein SORBI_3007G084650 [Sorghum bicolor]
MAVASARAARCPKACKLDAADDLSIFWAFQAKFRISCLGHHQIAQKGLYHCCLVEETNREHGTCLTR